MLPALPDARWRVAERKERVPGRVAFLARPCVVRAAQDGATVDHRAVVEGEEFAGDVAVLVEDCAEYHAFTR
jgi:hypothetical protein